jgi:DNA-binding response OmpR family regulator
MLLLAAAGAAELQARLRLAISRRRSAVEGTLQFGDLVLHPASYTVSLGGKDLGLTLTEFKLLNFLVQHAGRAFTRTRLMHEVWGYDCESRARTVDVHVRRLRAKLGPEHESMVDTVRGVGHMAVTPPQPRWIVDEPMLSPVWASTAPTADPIAR